MIVDCKVGTRVSICILQLAILTSCVPPPVRFFQAPSPEHQVFTSFSDTVLVVEQSPGDSVSASAVAFALDLLDYAAAAQRNDVVSTVRRVIEAVPEPARIRGDEPGEHDAGVYLRVQRQDLAQQFDMMRADVLVVDAVRADTAVLGDDDGTARTWLALILTGRAALDPGVGVRSER